MNEPVTEIGHYELFIKRVENGWIVERRQRAMADPMGTMCRWDDTFVFNDIDRLQRELPILLGVPEANKLVDVITHH